MPENKQQTRAAHTRQVKMIYKGRLGEEDLQQCVMAIRKNAVECMQGVLRAMDHMDISLGLSENAPRKKVGCGIYIVSIIYTIW